jgi:hypothetical protein
MEPRRSSGKLGVLDGAACKKKNRGIYRVFNKGTDILINNIIALFSSVSVFF